MARDDRLTAGEIAEAKRQLRRINGSTDAPRPARAKLPPRGAPKRGVGEATKKPAARRKPKGA